MTPGDRRLLGGRSPAAFLRRHWQKRPLLVRGALSGFRDLVSPDQLAGLSCEEGVESRLVLVRGGTRPFQVLPGPQDPRRLRALPTTHWTLLVQGVDRHLPAVSRLRERFRFVPDWRIDDLMVSFAPRFGTVGPHVDSYDVFLLQGLGRRRWRIQRRPDPALRPGLDLRVLRRFRPDVEWVLEPGDLLYLPPGVAHHGVALEDSLTYSIGFRAPAHADLLAAAVTHCLRAIPASRLYEDPDLRPTRQPGEIARPALQRMRSLVRRELRRLDGPAFDRCVGAHLTTPADGSPEHRAPRMTTGVLRRRLRSGTGLARSPGSRIAFVRRPAGVDLFVDGVLLPLPPRLAFAAPLLTGAPHLDRAALAPHLARPGFLPLLADLVSRGALVPARGSPRRKGRHGSRRGAGSRSRGARR